MPASDEIEWIDRGNYVSSPEACPEGGGNPVRWGRQTISPLKVYLKENTARSAAGGILGLS